MPELKNAENTFIELDGFRSNTVERWRDYARLTIPSLVPEREIDDTQEHEPKFQNLGAKGVNNIASKLVLTVLPPSSSFFKQIADPAAVNRVKNSNPQAESIIKKGLLQETGVINEFIASTNSTTALFQVYRYLAVTGECLPLIDDEGMMRAVSPINYVVERDGSGNVNLLIIKELVNPNYIADPEKAAFVDEHGRAPESNINRLNSKVMYTWVERMSNGKFMLLQETGGHLIPGTQKELKEEKLPLILPLTWTLQHGENYGRGLVEELKDDLRSYEALNQLLVHGAAQLAKIIWLADPNLEDLADDIAQAESGDVVPGRPDALLPLLAGSKGVDLRTALELSNMLDRRLSEGFLLNSAIQRDAERVTAEEVRLLAQDLDESLGGVFSNQARSFQGPYLAKIMSLLQSKGRLEKRPSGQVKTKIITGIEALGRGQELNKLTTGINLAMQIPRADQHLDTDGILQKIFEKVGVDTTGVLLDPQVVQQRAQQEQLNALAAQTAGPAAAAVSKNLTQ